MSYKIVRQTINGQRRTTVSNGWSSYDKAWERALELEAEMIDNEDCEIRYGQIMETFIVEKE